MEEITEKQMKKIDSYLSGKNLTKFEKRIKEHPSINWVGQEERTGAIILGFKGTEDEVYATPFYEGRKGIPVDNSTNEGNLEQGFIETNKAEFDNVEDFANWYYNHINDIHKIAFPIKTNKYKITVFKDYTINGEEHTLEVNTPEEVFSFLEGIGYETQDKEINDLVKNGGEYKGLNDAEFKIEIIPAEEKVEDNPFNNAVLFVKEFKGYLVGKSIVVDKGVHEKISDVCEDANNNVVISIDENQNEFLLNKDQFKSFIDGEEIKVDDFDIQLVLQEDKKDDEFALSQIRNHYFVVDVPSKKILSGFEYKEDATKDFELKKKFGLDKISILKASDVQNLGIDFSDKNNWSTNEHDWEIIKVALEERVKEKEISPKESELYFKSFKENNGSVWAIKAALILLLNKEQRALRSSYSMSNLERIDEGCDVSCRIQKELKRIIAMEK